MTTADHDELMLQLAERGNAKLSRSPKLRKSLNMRPNTRAELDGARRDLDRKRSSTTSAEEARCRS